MESQPGMRQASRSREAIKAAFQRLLSAKGYGDVSVSEIAEAANVGRSTLYRHFQGKADILIALHEDLFQRIFVGDGDENLWLRETASSQLRAFLKAHAKTGGPTVSLSADVGADTDYIMRRVIEVLSKYVEIGLRKAFEGKEPSVPFGVLGCSVAGVFAMVMMSWKDAFRDVSGDEMAEYVHRMARGMVVEAFDL